MLPSPEQHQKAEINLQIAWVLGLVRKLLEANEVGHATKLTEFLQAMIAEDANRGSYNSQDICCCCLNPRQQNEKYVAALEEATMEVCLECAYDFADYRRTLVGRKPFSSLIPVPVCNNTDVVNMTFRRSLSRPIYFLALFQAKVRRYLQAKRYQCTRARIEFVRRRRAYILQSELSKKINYRNSMRYFNKKHIFNLLKVYCRKRKSKNTFISQHVAVIQHKKENSIKSKIFRILESEVSKNKTAAMRWQYLSYFAHRNCIKNFVGTLTFSYYKDKTWRNQMLKKQKEDEKLDALVSAFERSQSVKRKKGKKKSKKSEKMQEDMVNSKQKKNIQRKEKRAKIERLSKNNLCRKRRYRFKTHETFEQDPDEYDIRNIIYYYGYIYLE